VAGTIAVAGCLSSLIWVTTRKVRTALA
jgi:hypothetical protein